MNIQQRFKKITTFIFDIDGVLTDGKVLVLENGIQARTMSIRDGYALQLAVKKGYRVLVVSGAAISSVSDRLNKLGVTDIHFGITDKKALVEKFIKTNGLQAEEVLFMGDDMPDLPVMSAVGLPTCPADAVSEIKQVARYVSKYEGGNGCVREVLEVVLKLNEQWDYQPGIASR